MGGKQPAERKRARPGETSQRVPDSDPRSIRSSAQKGKRRKANSDLSTRIKQAADRIGGVAVLAKRLGVTPQSVGNWTGPKARVPGADRIVQIADATGVSLDWLLRGEGEAAAVAGNVADRIAHEEAEDRIAEQLAGLAKVLADIAMVFDIDRRERLARVFAELERKLSDKG